MNDENDSIDSIDIANEDSFKSLKWIIEYSEQGLYTIVGDYQTQHEVVNMCSDCNIAVYDYSGDNDKTPYSFNALENWIENNPGFKAYFVISFDLALTDKQDILRFNFSRDMLANLNKNIIFGMTGYLDERLSREAYDFYAYIKLKLRFISEKSIDTNILISADTSYERFTVSENDSNIKINEYTSEQILLTQAVSLINEAETETRSFNFGHALKLLFSAMEIRIKILGNEHTDTADVYSNISIVYNQLGDFKKAHEFIKKAMLIYEKAYGTENPITAVFYNNMGNSYESLRDYEKALIYHKKALSIREKVFITEHPNTAHSYNNMGKAYTNLGKYKDALEFYRKAADIYKKVFGKEHLNTVIAYNNTADVFTKMGDFETAMIIYQDTLDFFTKVFGNKHPSTANVYKNIAEIYVSQINYLKALDFYEKVYNTYKEILGIEHHKTKEIEQKIINLRKKTAL